MFKEYIFSLSIPVKASIENFSSGLPKRYLYWEKLTPIKTIP